MQIISMNIGGYATQFESWLLCIEVRVIVQRWKNASDFLQPKYCGSFPIVLFFFEDCQKTRKENKKKKTGKFNQNRYWKKYKVGQ